MYEAHMRPALNRSSAIWRFEGSNAIEIYDGITFDFYVGLPHVFTIVHNNSCGTFRYDVFMACKLVYLIFQSTHEATLKKPLRPTNVGATGQLTMYV